MRVTCKLHASALQIADTCSVRQASVCNEDTCRVCDKHLCALRTPELWHGGQSAVQAVHTCSPRSRHPYAGGGEIAAHTGAVMHTFCTRYAYWRRHACVPKA
eukprot:1157445-Pelagomonas_calceolata.AAC.11